SNSIIAEIRRVAQLVPGKYLSVSSFDSLSRIHSSTLRKRFGGWRQALDAAGLGHRFDDSNSRTSRDEIITELRSVAESLGTKVLTKWMFIDASEFGDGAVLREFGSWRSALSAAGLEQANLGKRYSDEQCFENLLKVW